MSLTLTLAVTDLERTARFYLEILGLRLETIEPGKSYPQVMMLMRGDAVILFRQSRHLEASHPALFQNLDRHAKGVGISLELEVPDLEMIGRNISSRELHLLYELEDNEHDRRELWLHDPDGYLLMISQMEKSDG